MAEEVEEQLRRIRDMDSEKADFKTEHEPVFAVEPGLSRRTVEQISEVKGEPAWMRALRLRALEVFMSRPLPEWGPDLSGLNFDEITYYRRPDDRKASSWDEVPEEIRETFERLGIPEQERRYLAGTVAQFESEGVYASLKKSWEKKGVIFCDMDTAVQKYPEVVREHFMKCVPITDNKFAALHAAVWSGGSFAYVPRGVRMDMAQPLSTYFRMNAAQEGQFEHTLIIIGEGAQAHYIEGCSAPRYSKDSLHSAVVEIYVKDNAQARYTTVQNWSKNVYNLNTKRAWVGANARMEWVGGSMGSKVTMLYPCSVLKGDNAAASHLNIAFGTAGTWKDGGAKVIHIGKNTKSKVVAKSLSMGGGVGIYRGLLRINRGALNAKAHVQCDALILDPESRSETYPHNEIFEPTAAFAHEASVGRISEDQVFYLQSRGLTEQEARSMIVLGFLDEVLREIPLEYSIELNRLITLEMGRLGAVG